MRHRSVRRYRPDPVPDVDGIRAIYHEREIAGSARYLADPWLRSRVAESGVRNLAQIYSQLKYTRAAHAAFSEDLLAHLRQHGFPGEAAGSSG